MKIIKNTPDELIIEERPFWLGAFLLLFFIAIIYAIFVDWNNIEGSEQALYVFLTIALAAAFVYFVKWVRISFLRSLDRIEILRRGLLSEEREAYPLKNLKSVRVVENRRSGSRGTKRIVLSFDKDVLNMLDVETRAVVNRRLALTPQPHNSIDAPMTAYYSGFTNADAVAGTINAWWNE